MRPGYRVYRWYRGALSRRPLLVNAVQTGGLMGFGDLISQTIIERKNFRDVDPKRLFRFAAIGFFMCGPVLRLWFGELHKRVGLHKGGKSLKKLLLMVFFDQAIFAPAYLLALLVCVGFSQGKPWTIVKQDIEIKFFDVLQLNYCIWPIIQILNFYFTPLDYQVLVGSIAALCWDTYLSWKMNRRSKEGS